MTRPRASERSRQHLPRCHHREGVRQCVRVERAQHGGGEIDVRDRVFAQQGRQIVSGVGELGCTHERSTVCVRGEQFEHSGVERGRRGLEDASISGEAESSALQIDERRESAMRHLDTLGGAGAAGGEQHVGQVVRRRARGGPTQGSITGTAAQQGLTLFRQARVDRYPRSAEPGDGPHLDDPVRSADRVHRNQVAHSDALCTQLVGTRGGACIELGIRPPFASRLQSDPLRVGTGRVGEDRRERSRRRRRHQFRCGRRKGQITTEVAGAATTASSSATQSASSWTAVERSNRSVAYTSRTSMPWCRTLPGRRTPGRTGRRARLREVRGRARR